MGKFQRVAGTGIHFKLPWLDQIAGRIDLRVQQLALDVETKTKGKVFVKIPVSVQYHVIADRVYEAFYKLAKSAATNFLLRVQPDLGTRAEDDSRRRVSAAVRVFYRSPSRKPLSCNERPLPGIQQTPTMGIWCGYMQILGNDEISAFAPDYE